MTERRNRTPQEVREGRSLYRMTSATFEPLIGSTINNVITEAIQIAQRQYVPDLEDKKGALISFVFNGVRISVRANSHPELIERDWSRALSGYIDKTVGPYPKRVLSKKELASDARIEAENEIRRQKQQAEYRAKEESKRRGIEARLTNAPSIEVANEVIWQEFKDKNKDPYDGAVVLYSERWARLMQVEIAEGRPLEEVAETTSHEADLEGITGFMYGAAVSTLAETWKHGEELRKWHNLKTQIGNEEEKANKNGGVLNRALLKLG